MSEPQHAWLQLSSAGHKEHHHHHHHPWKRRLEAKIKQTWSTASWLCEPLQRAGKQLMGMVAQIDLERFLDDRMRAELGAIPRLQRRLP